MGNTKLRGTLNFTAMAAFLIVAIGAPEFSKADILDINFDDIVLTGSAKSFNTLGIDGTYPGTPGYDNQFWQSTIAQNVDKAWGLASNTLPAFTPPPTGGSLNNYAYNFQESSLRIIFNDASDVRKIKLAKLSADIGTQNATHVQLIGYQGNTMVADQTFGLSNNFLSFTLNNDFLNITQLDLIPKQTEAVGGYFAVDDIQSVPEPGAWALLSVIAIGITIYWRRKRRFASRPA